jgi:hypothetical protein
MDSRSKDVFKCRVIDELEEQLPNERRNEMNVKYSRGRFALLAGTWMYKREIGMKQSLISHLIFFAALIVLIITGGNVMAGGLVDTSVERFILSDFSNSENITNPWWTLTAGNNFLYFAQDGDDCVWNLTEVTGTTSDLGGDFPAPYDGTNARIVLDRGWVDEGCEYQQSIRPLDNFQAFMATNPPPEEVTYDWYAQDSEKNIWYMGENTYDGDYGGSFTAGCDGAEAGIVLLGNPSKGDFYQQEFYEGEAEDWGKVLNFKKVDDLVCMKTKEWTPLERGAIEHKWYCSNGTVGELARIEELHGKTVIVELVDKNISPVPSAVGLPISPTPSCPSFTQP